MDDDDDFGNLYTDVLIHITTPFQSQHQETNAPTAGGNAASFQSRPSDINITSDNEEIRYGTPDVKCLHSNSKPNRAVGLNLNDSIQGKTILEPVTRNEMRGSDQNSDSNQEAKRIEDVSGKGGDGLELETRVLEKGERMKLLGNANFMEDDDGIDFLVEDRDNESDELTKKDNGFNDTKENAYISADRKENKISFMGGSMAGAMGSEQMITGALARLENLGCGHSNFKDDWESEDDLQIVLNDNNLGPMDIERMVGVVGGNDEDEKPLVIDANNGDAIHHQHHRQQMMMAEGQEWRGEEGEHHANGGKELRDVAQTSGGTAALAAAQMKIGYVNHAYHHPFHSQFKYLRPGAALGAAPVTAGGMPGQVQPPVLMGPMAGRGRGNWRPTKGSAPMQNGFHPGYGMPVWGVNAARRGFGSRLGFTLPSHKTIFEVDIDSFEDKPWRLPDTDTSYFFNFGLNEDSWKDYCKQLEQLQFETPTQSRIRVHESGRTEQDYDPDLPPELAAAVVIQDTLSENANHGKTDAGPTDLARACMNEQSPTPTGRLIPAETGSGDRLSSIDTRRPRMHDSNAIIEIIGRSSTDDGVAEQQDNSPARENLSGVDESDDLQQDDVEHIDGFSDAYNSWKGQIVASREPFKSTVTNDEIVREDALHFSLEVPVKHHSDWKIGIPNEERSTNGRGRIRSPKMTANETKREKEIMDDQKEESFDSGDGKHGHPLSSLHAIESDGKQAVKVMDDMNDESIMDDRGFDMEREGMAVDALTWDDEILMHSSEKQNLSLCAEQFSDENDDREDLKAKTGSSKNFWKFYGSVGNEVIQDTCPTHAGNMKRSVEDEVNACRKGHHVSFDTGRRRMAVKGREDSYAQRGENPNSSFLRNVKNESADWRKESDASEGSWHLREENLHRRRIRVEDTRKREYGREIRSGSWSKVRESKRSEHDKHHQSRNQLDVGLWRGAIHDQDMRSRQRDRDAVLTSRNENVHGCHSERRTEEAHISQEHGEKEGFSNNHRVSSIRKRERGEGSNQHKRGDKIRFKDDDMHYVRQKKDGLFQRERNEMQRELGDWHRLKQSSEVNLLRKREETRPVVRSSRAAEDNTWTSQSRGKDNYKRSGREHLTRDVWRHSDQLKRRDRVENGSFSQHMVHEDVYLRGNQISNDEKRARYGGPSSHDECVAYAADTYKVRENKKKESSRKSKESESGVHISLNPSKRSQDEHRGQICGTVNLRGRTEQESSKNEIHVKNQFSRKDGEGGSSDDEQPGSRRGRSKLERWTSHTEREFSVTSASSSLKSEDLDTHISTGALFPRKLPNEPSKKAEDKSLPMADDNDIGAEMSGVNGKVMEEQHLNTVAKLKRQSERFKLPIPSEKDAIVINKLESEPLPLAQTEINPDSDIKSEQPARKSR